MVTPRSEARAAAFGVAAVASAVATQITVRLFMEVVVVQPLGRLVLLRLEADQHPQQTTATAVLAQLVASSSLAGKE